MNEKLKHWKTKAGLAGVIDMYDIDYDNESLNYVRNIEALKYPIPPVRVIGCRAFSTDKYRLQHLVKQEDMTYVDIHIPDTVSTIEREAFSDNILIKSITVGKNVLTIDTKAFKDCKNLEKVNLNEGLKELGIGVFNGCESLSEINLPRSLEHINGGVFYKCKKLSNIRFESYGASISGSALIDTPWAKEYLKKHTYFALNGRLIMVDKVNSFVVPDEITSIAEGCFRNNRKISSVVLNSKIKEIPANCFRSCHKLSKINLNNIEEIGHYAFFFCKSLDNIVLNDNIGTLRLATFRRCKKLKTIHLPSRLKVIEPLAFDEVDIEDLTLPNTTEKVYDTSFYAIDHEFILNMPTKCKIMKCSIENELDYSEFETNNYWDYTDYDTNFVVTDGEYKLENELFATEFAKHRPSIGFYAPKIVRY